VINVKRLKNLQKNSKSKDGHRSECKQCFNIAHKKYRQDPIVAEVRRANVRRWEKDNPEKRKISKAASDKRCRPHIRAYMQNKRDTDINYRLGLRLRIRLWHALKGKTKDRSAVRDLGCSIDELKEYLESKFQLGMSWDNYGEWHIDHVIPLNNFDLTDESQIKEACNFKNLQPLWEHDNLTKGSNLAEVAYYA